MTYNVCFKIILKNLFTNASLHFLFVKRKRSKRKTGLFKVFLLKQNHREVSKFLTPVLSFCRSRDSKFLTKLLCYTANKPKIIQN